MSDKSYQYLNLNNAWPAFQLDGLANDGGVLQLASGSDGLPFVECGTFLAGPLGIDQADTAWDRLQVWLGDLPAQTHLQLFSYSSDQMDGVGANVPLLPASCAATVPFPATAEPALQGTELTPLDQWRVAPRDALDFLLLNQPGRYLWLVGILQGDGSASPALQQVKLQYNRPSWLRHLPSVHQQDGRNSVFLGRALSLFEGLLSDQESLLDQLPRLFDPAAADDTGAPLSWLDWLAGWLAFPLNEVWDEGRRRSALASAFHLYSQRGTVESMRQLIELYADAHALINEPHQQLRLWSLGETSTLGFSTMLSPAHAQGAVVGTTATLDQSHLIEEKDFGAPLFEDDARGLGGAHHFCVQVYASEVPDQQALEKVRRLIDREKPAHTTYHLCPIGPSMRVGHQARIGIDTIVASSGAWGRLSEQPVGVPSGLGVGSVLPAAEGSRIGRSSKVGYSVIEATDGEADGEL